LNARRDEGAGVLAPTALSKAKLARTDSETPTWEMWATNSSSSQPNDPFMTGKRTVLDSGYLYYYAIVSYYVHDFSINDNNPVFLNP
jgi:hypothetical protein